MTSFVPGLEKFVTTHVTSAAASDLIAQGVLDAQYTGCEIEVTTTGLVQGVGVVATTSKIIITRAADSGGNLTYASTVAKLVASGGTVTHTVSVQGVAFIIGATISGTGSGSQLTHYVQAKGDKLRIKAL